MILFTETYTVEMVDEMICNSRLFYQQLPEKDNISFHYSYSFADISERIYPFHLML